MQKIMTMLATLINSNDNMLMLLQYVIYIIAFYGIRKVWSKLIRHLSFLYLFN